MRYKDTWTKHIPKAKLASYRQMIEMGVIVDPKVTYSRTTKITTVEYSSDLTHDQVKQLLREAVDA